MVYPPNEPKFNQDRAEVAAKYMARSTPIEKGDPGALYITRERGLPMVRSEDLRVFPDPHRMTGEFGLISVIRKPGEADPSAIQVTYIDVAGRISQHPRKPKDKKGNALKRDTFALLPNGSRDGLSVVGEVEDARDLVADLDLDLCSTAFLVEGRLEKVIPLRAIGVPHVYGAGGLHCIGYGVPPEPQVVVVEDKLPEDRRVREMHERAYQLAIDRLHVEGKELEHLWRLPGPACGCCKDVDDVWRGHGPEGLVEWLGKIVKAEVSAFGIARRLARMDRAEYSRQRKNLKDEYGFTTLKDLDALRAEGLAGGVDLEEDAAAEAVAIALDAGIELTHDDAEQAFATVVENGASVTHRVRSRGFQTWFRNHYREAKPRRYRGREVGATLKPHVCEEATQTLEAMALDGPEIRPFARIGWAGDDRVYIDLANPELSERYVEIRPGEWHLVSNPAARLVHMPNAHPLPAPVRVGEAERASVWARYDRLVRAGEDRALFRGYLGNLVFPYGPHASFIFLGDTGAGKTSTGKVMKGIVDPTKADARMAPRSTLDMVIGAYGCWFPMFDNLSRVNRDFSDVTCQILDGAGLSMRQLYTTYDEALIELGRPIMFTSINYELISAPDLIDRAITCQHDRVRDADRIEETELLARMREIRPQLLGILCDAVAEALKGWRNVDLGEHVPRRIGLARWVEAAHRVYGLERGEFAKAYRENQRSALRRAARANPVVNALLQLLAGLAQWSGRATDLYNVLTERTREKGPLPPSWPRNVSAFGMAISQAVIGLEALGWKVESRHRDTGTEYTFTPAAPHEPDEPDRADKKNRAKGGSERARTSQAQTNPGNGGCDETVRAQAQEKSGETSSGLSGRQSEHARANPQSDEADEADEKNQEKGKSRRARKDGAAAAPAVDGACDESVRARPQKKGGETSSGPSGRQSKRSRDNPDAGETNAKGQSQRPRETRGNRDKPTLL